MSTRLDTPDSPPVESRDDLVAYLEAGCKPPDAWRIGTEHEKFGFHTADLTPLAYDGPAGIRTLLEQMAARFDYEPIREGDNIIALKQPGCPQGGTITLEPGGQFELSGAPLVTVHETCEEASRHLDQVRQIGDDFGIGFLGVGYSPKWTLAETPLMPKGRYAIMKSYMPKVGTGGLDMMFRTCTVQVNLDFADEADMVRKFRVGLALQPVATAIFANSPFKEGRPNGFLSLRSELWRHTDPDRTGMLPFVFEDGMGFERYAEYALDVPMYFIYRAGRYVDATQGTFRDFLDGRHPQLAGERPNIDDWSDHLTTLFPEVRMKRFLEMRGGDGSPWRGICALPAFWTGLIYDPAALEAAWSLVRDWTAEERQALRDQVPRQALKTPFRNRLLLDVAREAVAIAREGLKARARRDGLGDDETQFLEPVEAIVAGWRTPAEAMLEEYANDWHGDIDRIFRDHAY